MAWVTYESGASRAAYVHITARSSPRWTQASPPCCSPLPAASRLGSVPPGCHAVGRHVSLVNTCVSVCERFEPGKILAQAVRWGELGPRKLGPDNILCRPRAKASKSSENYAPIYSKKSLLSPSLFIHRYSIQVGQILSSAKFIKKNMSNICISK